MAKESKGRPTQKQSRHRTRYSVRAQLDGAKIQGLRLEADREKAIAQARCHHTLHAALPKVWMWDMRDDTTLFELPPSALARRGTDERG